MEQGRGRVGQRLLGVVDRGTLEGFVAGDLVQRQVGEQAHEAADVGVLGVAPELPVVVGAELFGVQPDRALGRLAHLAAGGRGQQRRGQAEGGLLVHAADQVDARDDIAPLVRAAHLQGARRGGGSAPGSPPTASACS